MEKVIVEVEVKKETENAEIMADAIRRMLQVLGYRDINVHTETMQTAGAGINMPERTEIEIMPFMGERRKYMDGRKI